MPEELFEVFRVKATQRAIEYAALLVFQGFLALNVLSFTGTAFAIAFAASGFGVAWTLAFAREARRILPLRDLTRLKGDASESLLVLFFMLGTGVAAQLLGLPVEGLLAHVAIVFFMYLLGSFGGELAWRKRFFRSLSLEQQGNYIGNLNRSLLFPYNISYLRRLFGSASNRRRRRKPEK